jgi:hypothetical protein
VDQLPRQRLNQSRAIWGLLLPRFACSTLPRTPNTMCEISPIGREPWDPRSGGEDRSSAIRPGRPPLPQPQDWPRILTFSGSTRAGISGMLCRGSRNGNALESSSRTLLERFPSRALRHLRVGVRGPPVSPLRLRSAAASLRWRGRARRLQRGHFPTLSIRR